MNTLQLKQVELSNLIFNITSNEIEKLISFVEINNLIPQKSKQISLAGIWSDKDFETINLEEEIRDLRNGLTSNLDKIEL
jgi:hypothetical protein